MMVRNPIYDRAKGIGMILVIYGHMLNYGSIPFSFIFSFHMPLFFIVSGMLLSPSKFDGFNYQRWAKSTIKKYIPPVVFFSVLGGGVRYAFYGTPDWRQMAKDFILHMSSDELLTGSIWFLSMLAFVMLLIPFLIRIEWFGTGRGKVCLVVTLSVLAYLLSKVPYTLPFLIKTIPTALLFVYIGYIAKDVILEKTNSITTKRYVLFLLPVFLILVVLNRTVNLAVPVYNDFFVYLFCALFGTIMTLQISTYRMPRFIEYLGKNSLIVFSLHAIWIFIFTDILNRILGTTYAPMVDMPHHYVLISGVIVILMTALSTMLVLPIYNATLKFLKLK